MRVIKFSSVFILALTLCVSCEKLEPEKVVFYSKDQLIENLAVKINNTDGVLVSVNSNTIISLNSSEYFKTNLVYLRDLSVPKMCFKLKNYHTNPSTTLSNISVFVDDIQITNEMGQNFLKTINNNIEFEIKNPIILSLIASKLLQKKQVIITFRSDAVTKNQFDFGFEFSITAKGTFVD